MDKIMCLWQRAAAQNGKGPGKWVEKLNLCRIRAILRAGDAAEKAKGGMAGPDKSDQMLKTVVNAGQNEHAL